MVNAGPDEVEATGSIGGYQGKSSRIRKSWYNAAALLKQQVE